jgi:hypothetical protein
MARETTEIRRWVMAVSVAPLSIAAAAAAHTSPAADLQDSYLCLYIVCWP